MKSKRLFAILLTGCMLFGMLPTAAFAADLEEDQVKMEEVLETPEAESPEETPEAPAPAEGDALSDEEEGENLVASGEESEEISEEELIAPQADGIDWSAATITISTPEELQEFAQEVNSGRNFKGQTVKLAGDIDLSGVEWTPIGFRKVLAGETAITEHGFSGTFDGEGYSISNLTVYAEGEIQVGLFGWLSSGTLQNVTIVNAEVTADYCVGALAGAAYTGRVENCHVEGDIQITGHYDVGGLTGYGYARLENCSVVGNDGSAVTGTYKEADLEGDNVGGLIGYRTEGTTMTDCHVENLTVMGTRKVGGLIGSAHGDSSFAGCSAENVTVGTNASSEYADTNKKTMGVGGLIGLFNGASGGKMENCGVENVTLVNETGVFAKMGYVSGGGRDSGDFSVPNMTFTNVTISGTNTGTNVTVQSPVLSGNIKTENSVARVGEEYFESLQAAVDAVQDGGVVTLVADVVDWSVTSGDAVIEKEITVDLAGKTLNIAGVGANGVLAQNGGSLTLKNGAVTANGVSNPTNPVIEVTTGASVTLDGVTMTTDGVALFPRGDAAKVSVVNGSEVSAKAYAVSTNAAGAENYNVVIELKDSTFSGRTAVILNVPGKLSMDNCVVNGVMQGVLLRGGEAEIQNSTIVQEHKQSISGLPGATAAEYFEGKNWGAGNMANLAGITIGNKGNSYQYPSHVTISNTIVKVEGEDGALFPCIYVWANEAQGMGVTLSMADVTCEGEYEPKIVYGNEKNNITVVEPVARVGGKIYGSLQAAIDAVKEGDTVTLVADVVTESVVIAAGKTVTLDLNGKKLEGSTADTITNNGTLTIKDSAFASAGDDESKMGKIVGMNVPKGSTTSPKIAVVNNAGGVCIIESGMITRAPYLAGEVQDNTSINSNYTISNKGEMTIAGGLIVNNSSKSSMVANVTRQSGNVFNGTNNGRPVTMNITGGTLKTETYTALKNDPGAMMNISGGDIVNNTSYVTQFYGTVNISGGNFTGGDLWVCSHADSTGDYPTEVNVTAGTLNVKKVRVIYAYTATEPVNPPKAELLISGPADVACEALVEEYYDRATGVVKEYEQETDVNSDILISDGTFHAPVELKHCADGFLPVSNENGTYGVIRADLAISASRTSVSGGGAVTLAVTPANVTGLTVTCDVEGINVTGGNGTFTATLPNTTASYTFTATVGGKTAECVVSVTRYTSSGGSSGGGSSSARPTTPVEEDLADPNVPLAQPLPFSDVTENDWFYDAVRFVYERDMMKGTNDGTTFEPAMTTTRGMIVTIFHRMEGEPEAAASAFADVGRNAWYSAAVDWAAANGIVKGYEDGSFRPEDIITRQEMAAIFSRYATFKGYDKSAVGDMDLYNDKTLIADWALKDMTWAVGAKVLSGKGNNLLDPVGTTSRAEAAQMLKNFCAAFVTKAEG